MSDLHEIDINALHPTQITVGMIEVDAKRREIADLMQNHPHHLARYIAGHTIPVVAGCDGQFFLIDHHHLARALREAGVTSGPFQIIADLSALPEDQFWAEMERQNWVHPYDEYGRKQDYSEIPHCVTLLRNDPYRSLAGYVRQAGGYEKSPAPFAEFLWADYFRPRIAPADLIEPRFEDTVQRAVALAHAPAAAQLPGYIKADASASMT